MVPSAAIHSPQPSPHALASPRPTKNTIGGGSLFDFVSGGAVRVVAGGSAGAGARCAPAGVAVATPRTAAIRRRPRAVMPRSGSAAKTEIRIRSERRQGSRAQPEASICDKPSRYVTAAAVAGGRRASFRYGPCGRESRETVLQPIRVWFMSTDKFDPYDVNALERSVNDSAARVSTIWISFLIFALYLVVAAGTITHRQLFLEDPVKLPVLNIDLPLWGFFFLAPILFVILHAYVLLQVLLLGRTAAAYNTAVDRAVRPPTGNASVRQRLANTLFAQIFAGSPRERDGVLGWMLRLMAWITLAIAPVLVLLVFQFKFL